MIRFMSNAPIVASLSGVIAGGGLTFLGQWLTDRRARVRERLRIEVEAGNQRDFAWAELQQRSIIDLQDAMRELWYVALAVATAPSVEERKQAYNMGDSRTGRVFMLLSRIDDRELAEDIRQWVAGMERGLPKAFTEEQKAPIAEFGIWRENFLNLIDRLGTELRRSVLTLRKIEGPVSRLPENLD